MTATRHPRRGAPVDQPGRTAAGAGAPRRLLVTTPSGRPHPATDRASANMSPESEGPGAVGAESGETCGEQPCG